MTCIFECQQTSLFKKTKTTHKKFTPTVGSEELLGHNPCLKTNTALTKTVF